MSKILMKLEVSKQTFMKFSNFNFQ